MSDPDFRYLDLAQYPDHLGVGTCACCGRQAKASTGHDADRREVDVCLECLHAGRNDRVRMNDVYDIRERLRSGASVVGTPAPAAVAHLERMQSVIEYGTPRLSLCQHFHWPIVGDDFGRFIGFASVERFVRLGARDREEARRMYLDSVDRRDRESLGDERVLKDLLETDAEVGWYDYYYPLFAGLDGRMFYSFLDYS